ncbi:MAG TPA: nitroreductase/quinone reductase family protein, partial [Pseudomonadales bacterium]
APSAKPDGGPAWWLDLQAHPHARIQVRDRCLSVRARRASEQECAGLWPQLVTSYRGYTSYQRQRRHGTPIVILEPASRDSDFG